MVDAVTFTGQVDAPYAEVVSAHFVSGVSQGKSVHEALRVGKKYAHNAIIATADNVQGAFFQATVTSYNEHTV